MELEIPISCGSIVPEGCQSSPTLPRWSKTGRRTRAARAHHQGLVASDDEAHDLSVLKNDAENLPPKKRKLDSTQVVIGGNDVVIERNGKDMCRKIRESRERKQHACNICSRSFSSYQALGGHKAHHNTKGTPAAAEDDAVVECGEPPGGGGGGAVHRCTHCYKVFSKGQALGGHRRHCQRPMAIPEKMFTFDLNKLPPDWLES